MFLNSLQQTCVFLSLLQICEVPAASIHFLFFCTIKMLGRQNLGVEAGVVPAWGHRKNFHSLGSGELGLVGIWQNPSFQI